MIFPPCFLTQEKKQEEEAAIFAMWSKKIFPISIPNAPDVRALLKETIPRITQLQLTYTLETNKHEAPLFFLFDFFYCRFVINRLSLVVTRA